MCQIVIFTRTNPAERNRLIELVWETMKNSNQRDGYGAAWSSDKEIGYVKSSVPFIVPGGEWPPFLDGADSYFGYFNDLPSDGGPLMIHGRTATNPKTLDNTHPMLWSEDGSEKNVTHALIHNGVVESEQYFNHLTTCDSELILHGGIDEVGRAISGRFAFASLEIGRKGQNILNVVRDDKALLNVGLMPDGSYVFATTQHLIDKVGGRYMAEMKNMACVTFVNSKFTHSVPFQKTAIPPFKGASSAVPVHGVGDPASTNDGPDHVLELLPGETNKQRKRRLNRLRHEKRKKEREEGQGSGRQIMVPRDRRVLRPDPKSITNVKDMEKAMQEYAESERINLPSYVEPVLESVDNLSQKALLLHQGEL